MKGSAIRISLCLFTILLLPPLAYSQSFTIDGITGIEFDDSGGDYSISITEDFTIFGISVIPGSLTLTYTSSEELFEIDGSVTTNFDGEEIEAELDFSVSDEALESVAFNVTTDFTLRSLELSPSGLGFEWTGGTNFGIYGELTATLEGNEMDVSMGDSDTPGVVIENGLVTSIEMSVTGNFDIKTISITPEDLTFVYSSGEEQFEMYGSATTTIEEDEIDLALGDEDDPGIIYESGSLTHINFGITAEFDLKGLTLSPDGLTMEYDSGDSQFEFYGAATASLESNEINFDLGDADSPGFVLSSGTISDVNFGVSGNFDIKTISITPEDLTFVYSSGEDQFEMYGSATTTIDGNEIAFAMGDEDDPGVILDSGTLTHIKFGVTADFDMKEIAISPDNLTLEYDQSEDYFEFYGSVSVKFDGEEIDAELGDSGDPGIVFDSGNITHVNFGLTADFEIKSLAIIPDNLTFEYDSGEDYFEMYGDMTFKIGSDEVTANMGDSDDPGLVFDNGSITHVNIGVTEDFSMSGLKIKTNDLGVEWDSGTDYNIYGDANLSIDSETIDTDFGTSSDPGIVIKNGSLHSFEVDVNSDLKFGNLEVTTKDVDIKYSSSKFEVTGEIEIDEVFSLSVTLGSGDQAGLEVDVSGSEPKFKIEDLTIDIEHADLGTIDLKKFELAFNSSGITESEVDVVFPSGTDIDAVLKFKGDPASIDEISITYTADNLEEALELFEGIQIAEMSGTVGNLTKSSDLYIDADLTTIFGGGFTLDGESVTLLEMYDAVTIDADEFTMSGDVNVGAYKSGSNWHSLLGDGSFTLDVIFQDYSYTETYNPFSWIEEITGEDLSQYDETITVHKSASVKATIDVKIPSDPLVEAEASAYVNSEKDFDALVDVTLYVPSSIPFIGGDKLGSVDGAIRYKYNDLSDSYAAGWTDIKVLWTKYYLGAKYKFSSRSVSTFSGKSHISDIEDDISDDENSKTVSAPSPYIVSSHTFELYDDPVAPNYLQFIADWGSEIDSVLVTVIGPEGIYELTRATLESKDDSTGQPTFGYEENMNWVTQDTGAVFIIHSPSAMSEEEIGHATLIAGRYQVLISIPRSQAPDSVSLDVTSIIQSPIIDAEISKTGNSYEIDANYWSSVPDSSFVSFYVNTVNSPDNAILISHAEAENFDEFGYGTETIVYSPDVIHTEDSLFFFAVIDDGYNPPIRMEYALGVLHAPDFYGTISFPEEADSLKSGLRIFIDEDVDGSFDVASTGGLELFAISGKEGQFAITGLEEGSYEVRIVLPPGYRIAGGTDRKSHQPITFEGTPIKLDLEIEAYTEAE